MRLRRFETGGTREQNLALIHERSDIRVEPSCTTSSSIDFGGAGSFRC
jgi:hypothetical protein